MDIDKIVKSAVKHFFVISTISTLFSATDAIAAQKMEKCYGIVKAGMNDCATAKSQCASSATKDNQRDAFLFLPQGDCDKIVGGHLTATDKK